MTLETQKDLLNKAFLESLTAYQLDTNDQKAFYRLYRIFYPIIFWVVKKNMGIPEEHKQDVIQDIMVKYQKALTRITFTSFDKARAYLLQTTKNTITDFRRKKDNHFLRFEESIMQDTAIFPQTERLQLTLKDKYDLVSPYWKLARTKISKNYRIIIDELYRGTEAREISRKIGEKEFSQKRFSDKAYKARIKFRKILLKCLENASTDYNLSEIERRLFSEIVAQMRKKQQ